MKTTLNQIRDCSPCADGWVKLLSHLGKTKADDEPLTIATIMDSNGLDDALWCLQAVEGKDREIRLYAVWCVRQIQNLLADKRSLEALDVAEAFAEGRASKGELAAAEAAARAAAEAAADAAAWGAAWGAARAAAEAAAEGAAWTAAEGAARAAAWTAAEGVAEGAAWDAARATAKASQADKLRQIQ